MIASEATAKTADIVVDTAEMEDVRWFPRADVAAMYLASRDQAVGATPDSGARFIPGSYAIAHHLIRRWLFPDGAPPPS